VLEGMLTSGRTLPYFPYFWLSRTSGRQMDSSIEPHEFLESGFPEFYSMVTSQVALKAKPSGLAVFFLQLEYRVDGTEIDLPFGMMGHVQPIQKRFSLGDTALLFFSTGAAISGRF
jgi:hypothetical protein